MDIKTLLLALALANLSLCAALFFSGHEGRPPRRPSTFASARLCQAVAWLLLALRDIAPDLLTIGLANALLFTGFALDAGALWEQAGRRGWRRVLLPALGGAIAVFAACYVMDLPPGQRVAAASLILSGFACAGVAALAQGWATAGALRRYLVLSTGVLALALAARGMLGAIRPEGWGWLTPAVLQWLGVALLYLLTLGSAYGYLLLSGDRLRGELARLEVVDGLTGVPNRRGFYQALGPWLALARRPGQATALLVLNLDHFKRVNDGYGHPVGDLVLKTMVEICQRQLRDSDLMGRLGGAEFAILLPRTSAGDALLVAERIRGAVAATPVKAERALINMTASLGVTTIRADDTPVLLFQRADDALRQAKQDGRNRVAQAGSASPLEA
ncbi:diguanylate cyclase [Oxalobacteraceae bacterium A2-2]